MDFFVKQVIFWIGSDPPPFFRKLLVYNTKICNEFLDRKWPLGKFSENSSNFGRVCVPNTQLTQTWVGGDASASRLIGDSVVRELSSSPPAMDWEVRLQVSLGSDLWVRMSVTKRAFADLTDVTLTDEDTNSILTDNANRAMQWCNLVVRKSYLVRKSYIVRKSYFVKKVIVWEKVI